MYRLMSHHVSPRQLGESGGADASLACMGDVFHVSPRGFFLFLLSSCVGCQCRLLRPPEPDAALAQDELFRLPSAMELCRPMPNGQKSPHCELNCARAQQGQQDPQFDPICK